MLPTSAEASSWALNPALLHQLTSPATRGLLVVGQLTNPADVAAAAAVADALGWPVVADALSGTSALLVCCGVRVCCAEIVLLLEGACAKL